MIFNTDPSLDFSLSRIRKGSPFGSWSIVTIMVLRYQRVYRSQALITTASTKFSQSFNFPMSFTPMCVFPFNFFKPLIDDGKVFVQIGVIQIHDIGGFPKLTDSVTEFGRQTLSDTIDGFLPMRIKESSTNTFVTTVWFDSFHVTTPCSGNDRQRSPIHR